MDMFRHYNDKTYIYDNKHHYCACGCVDFHRFYVCKHLLALVRLLKLRLKGFVSEGFFATLNFLISNYPFSYYRNRLQAIEKDIKIVSIERVSRKNII
ncbi:hypothetical protein BpHYR1_009398 [Brachionus plicatilis]|uniref:SWIM-type domain-containing protein n=1 Tax=Brachionus plicatilis TaxID=10195 RepID=A0A3M7PGT7_BRAPC|nr:hypothetical protein BpHYR1_009398 [Brachionus plicatilis]